MGLAKSRRISRKRHAGTKKTKLSRKHAKDSRRVKNRKNKKYRKRGGAAPKPGPKKRDIPDEDAPDENDYEHWADSDPERYTAHKGWELFLEGKRDAAIVLMEEMSHNKDVNLDAAYNYAVAQAAFTKVQLDDRDKDLMDQALVEFHDLVGVANAAVARAAAPAAAAEEAPAAP